MVLIVPALPSPDAPDIVCSFPVLFMLNGWKDTGVVFTRARPRFQAQQYGGRHGSQRVFSNWRFDQEYESPRGRAAGDLEKKNPFLYWEKIFDVNKDSAEGAKTRWSCLRTPGFTRAGKWSFHDLLWLRFVLKKKRTPVDLMIFQDEVSRSENTLGTIAIASIPASGFCLESRIARSPFSHLAHRITWLAHFMRWAKWETTRPSRIRSFLSPESCVQQSRVCCLYSNPSPVEL